MSKCISLVCIVNKQEVYDGFLESLKLQSYTDYQLIPVMNMNNEYDGARKAFNQACKTAEGKYIFFIHPDIRFLSADALGKLVSQVEECEDFAVIGVAGARQKGTKDREILTTIVQGADKSPVGQPIDSAVEVQTIDECLFIVKRDWFEEHPFVEKEGWHLYGVEYCLASIRLGKSIYAVPSEIWHMSAGASLDEKYMSQLEQLIGEYSKEHQVLATTVKAWKTGGTGAKLYRKYYYLKQLIKRKLVK